LVLFHLLVLEDLEHLDLLFHLLHQQLLLFL
jgi:hypothetical protein